MYFLKRGKAYSVKSKQLFLDLLVNLLNDIGPTF